MEHKKYHITYLDKTLHTDHWYDLSVKECNLIRKEYYEKPDFDLIKKNFKLIYKGSTNVSHIVNYYIKDLMAKVKQTIYC